MSKNYEVWHPAHDDCDGCINLTDDLEKMMTQRDELLNLVEESIEEHEQQNDCTGPGEKCMWCQRAAKAIALAKGTK